MTYKPTNLIMSELLTKMLELHKKGELNKEVFDNLKDEEKTELLKEIDGLNKYNSLSVFLKGFEKDAEEAEAPEGDDAGTEDAGEGTDETDKSTEPENKKETEGDAGDGADGDDAGESTDTPENKSADADKVKEQKPEDDELMKKRVDAEAAAYKKALDSHFKQKDYGIHSHTTGSETEKEQVNANLRKAFASGQMSNAGINLFEKAADGSKYMTTEIAEKIFEAPEVPTRLIDRFYSKRVTEGDTVRFNEIGSVTAAQVAKNATISYGDGAATTSDTVTLKKYASGFNIAYEDTQDPQVDLQALLTRKASEAVRDKIEVDAVAAVVANLASNRKVAITGSKGSNANNLSQIDYEDLMGLGSVIDVFGIGTPQFAAHPSIFRYILSRTDTAGQKIFEGKAANADDPGNIEGIQTLPTSGLGTYNTLKAASAVAAVVLQSDWENTCGVAFDVDSLRVMSTYNQTSDSYDVAVFGRGVATPVVTSQIAALEISVS